MPSAVLLDHAGDPVPSFSSYLAALIPIGFLRGIRELVNSGCELGFPATSPTHDNDLPYWKNIQPHERNAYVFEGLHRLAEETGMKVEAKSLSNRYRYPEIETLGLLMHIKHENDYQSLTEQIAKADYRRQMTTLNTGFGQLSLGFSEWPLVVPDKAYVILFYNNGEDKGTAGNIFFVLPSREHGNIVAKCDIEEVLAAYNEPDDKSPPAPDDEIDLPPKSPGAGGNKKSK